MYRNGKERPSENEKRGLYDENRCGYRDTRAYPTRFMAWSKYGPTMSY